MKGGNLVNKFVKVIELLAIENHDEKSYLRIKLSFEEEYELCWEIDRDTANNLKNICQFNGNHKYRLSLHITSETSNNYFKSVLTKTYLNTSQRIYFNCSVEYKKNLEAIKNSNSMNDLDLLPFLSISMTEIEDTIATQTNSIISKRYNTTIKWISGGVIGFIFIILFGYIYNLYLYEAEINNTVVANAEAKIKEVNSNSNVTSHTNLSSEVSSNYSFPYVMLTDSVAYDIPEEYVAITFDDGPSKYTTEITDILKEYKVGGTFFFLGINAKKHPDFVRYVQSNGYSIGSHSMNHISMSNLSITDLEDQILQSTLAIEDITKEKLVLFRPPYGALNEQTKDVLYNHDYKITLWNKDPEDWKSRDADKIFDYVRNNKTSGSIILLHESQAVIDALPKIIEYLQEQDLKIVNLH